MRFANDLTWEFFYLKILWRFSSFVNKNFPFTFDPLTIISACLEDTHQNTLEEENKWEVSELSQDARNMLCDSRLTEQTHILI